MREDAESRLSPASARRLSQYLRLLRGKGRQTATISSEELARNVGVSAAQVRRDLAALGHLGQRGIGYEISGLTEAIRTTLGIHREWRAIVVGVGNLARALLKYRGFAEQGFHVVALFDNDPAKIGVQLEGLVIEPLEDLKARVAQLHAELAILAVPPESAGAVAEKIAAAGIRGILNFAPALIHTAGSGRIPMISVDLAIQLEQLAYQVESRSSARTID